MKRLLILGCSATKRPLTGRVPAWNLYDGSAFRVVKSWQREHDLYPFWTDDLTILILSAKEGLITPGSLIRNYDQRMSPDTAKKMRPRLRAELALNYSRFDEVFLMLGKDYLEAIGPLDVFGKGQVIIPPGGIGEKLGALKRWLGSVMEVAA